MLKFNPTTPIAVYAKNEDYVPGIGASKTWEQVKSTIGSVETGAFYCEWRGTYGDRLLTAQSLGVSDLVTIRMTFNPDVYAALLKKECVIVKNADSVAMQDGQPDITKANVYELYSGADNVAQENQFLEFQARRYQGK